MLTITDPYVNNNSNKILMNSTQLFFNIYHVKL